MPILLPNLDDRRWADLVEEGRALLPVLAPGWTDHNVSDPGLMLIELFAALGEQSTYRLNRITPRHRLKFLELVGCLPHPARASRSVLTMRLAAVSPAQQVPASTEFACASGMLFRTLRELHVGTARLQTLQRSDGVHFRALSTSQLEGFAPFGRDPKPEAALYLGFDRALSAGEPLSLYVDTALAGQSAPTHPDDVEVRWEYRDGSAGWLPLDVEDQTRALRVAGPIQIELPAGGAMSPTRIGSVSEPYWYLRCRLVSGQFDAAPVVRTLLCHAVEVEQAFALHGESEAQGREVGTGTGAPWQRIALPAAPVLAESVRVWSLVKGELLEWEARADLSASGPSDRHFVLDSTHGELRFGNDRHGRAPELDAPLYASLRATEAERGLLAAQDSLSLASTSHNAVLALPDELKTLAVAMPVPAWGGAAAEDLDRACTRAASEREAAVRAVTLSDYELLAMQTPGVQLARVHALANHHPALECVKAPGWLTVVVVPFLPLDAPQPSLVLRAAVKAQLQRRRVLGTRVEVVGPSYLKVAVRARVRCLRGQRSERVRRDVVAALDSFLDPLRGGPTGEGWPFGRDVYRSEILQTIDEVPGVDHVLDLALVAGACDPSCGNVCLRPTWLTLAGEHAVEVI